MSFWAPPVCKNFLHGSYKLYTVYCDGSDGIMMYVAPVRSAAKAVMKLLPVTRMR